MLKQVETGQRPTVGARLMMGASVATLALVLATPVLAQTVLGPVQVQGSGGSDYTVANSALSKLPEPLLDTPITVTTISQVPRQEHGEADAAVANGTPPYR